ncbi:MaoC/PaaZ C-terminal domain-containing protein [Alkalihalobacterium elongatum]|uniref:MaoC/PaaZ C-terminal domain-containing protein n=1 Tax=Alkalihalobacterium elongatum TaxID=2675466 RepID=UPI001C1F9EC0|nr:MaoC/PaaZ C-terminal domain-containing protein [Alkalihalobacterium elongatum]
MKFDEIENGITYQTASYEVTKEDVFTFASQYDPQFMHVDEEKAKQSMFGGIIASGLHTLSITWKLWVDMDIIGDDIIGGAGMNYVKFAKPVYPEDHLSVEVKMIDKKEHPKYSDRGFVTTLLRTFNQDEELVLEIEMVGLVKR